MPLKHSPSKKAFSENVRTEMEHGKPQDQSLAIAYSVQRKAKKKKMAEGGAISASNEKRPMPEDLHDDKHDAEETKKPHPKAQMAGERSRPKLEPIKHPGMVPSDAFSARLYDREGHLQESDKPGSYKAQPEHWMDEEKPMKMGKNPEMPKPHSTAKAYAEGGKIEGEHQEPKPHPSPMPTMKPEHILDSVRDFVNKHAQPGEYAEGGGVEDEREEMHDDSIAAAIMAKKAREKGHPAAMSDSDIDEMVMLYDGGEVDLGSEHMEEPNNEDQMSFEALKKENYNSSDLDIDQPMGSNEDSPEHEPMDEHDEGITSEIRKRMKHRQFKSQ